MTTGCTTVLVPLTVGFFVDGGGGVFLLLFFGEGFWFCV